MKELYLNPEMDVIKFSINDVIATSTTVEETNNPNCENEGPLDDI